MPPNGSLSAVLVHTLVKPKHSRNQMHGYGSDAGYSGDLPYAVRFEGGELFDFFEAETGHPVIREIKGQSAVFGALCLGNPFKLVIYVALILDGYGDLLGFESA